LLKAWGSGDEAALVRLTEHVYSELLLMARRYMKNEAQGNSLHATALVHEVYLRLVDVTNVEWQARAQFFAMAAQMMRRILVDAARKRGSRRRDGVPSKVNLDESAVLSPAPDRSILAVDEALTAFSKLAPR
jgi:RNA polymerase sigma factor (TIGR02999 family)